MGSMSSTFYYPKSDYTPYLSEMPDMPMATDDSGFFGGIGDFMEFIGSVRDVGFFQTVYGKSLPQVIGDSIKDIMREVWIFILCNGDLLFLMPAVALMFTTFFIGRNKLTRFILPLFFAYFISRLMFMLIL